ncbi:MAG TPA: OB-fold domain-containing protein [Thermoplasmata archaeon]|nr:OB-fold domain-containing protein [Thermoplasmata archaeon]
MPPPSPHSIREFVEGYETARTLRAFRCPQCGMTTVTWGLACSRCGASPLGEVMLADRGRVVAGTIVAVASEEFANDAPYAYVVVEMDDGGRLSGWMPNVRSPEAIAPGTPVRFAPSYKPGVQFRLANLEPLEERSR